jgi:DNA invertase Pin-like site-specific DNA recombinase
MEKYIAYYRVSGARQGETGIGLEAQRDGMIAHFGCHPCDEFIDIQSGNRKKLHKRISLIAAIKKSVITGMPLAVYKLDRLGRDSELLSRLINNNIQLIALDFKPLASSDKATSKMIMMIMMAYAEYESTRGSQRSTDAARIKRKRGQALGCPNMEISKHSDSGGVATILKYWNKEKQSAIDILMAMNGGHIPTKDNLKSEDLDYLKSHIGEKFSRRAYVLKIIRQYHIVIENKDSARLLLSDTLQ